MVTIKQYTANAMSISDTNTTLYFSYETVVAFRTGDQQFQAGQFFSRTTSKHLNLMGVREWPVMDSDEFKAIVNQIQIQLPLDA